MILRIPDDITCFEWHPHEPEVMIGGCTNGQLVLWDIAEYYHHLVDNTCTWNYNVLISSQKNKMHIHVGKLASTWRVIFVNN